MIDLTEFRSAQDMGRDRRMESVAADAASLLHDLISSQREPPLFTQNWWYCTTPVSSEKYQKTRHRRTLFVSDGLSPSLKQSWKETLPTCSSSSRRSLTVLGSIPKVYSRTSGASIILFVDVISYLALWCDGEYTRLKIFIMSQHHPPCARAFGKVDFALPNCVNL